MSRAALILALLSLPLTAVAQEGDVGLIEQGESADRAFLELLPIPTERRYAELEAARGDDSVAFVVDLRGADGIVRVWRRSDRATLERRLPEPDADGYALAVMGSELLEVARAGSTAEVVEVDDTPLEEPEPAAAATEEPALTEEASEPAPEGDGVAFTGGVAFEAWGSPVERGAWQLQPALALELAWLPGNAGWQLALGLEVAGLGQTAASVGTFDGVYQRYDFGGRLTAGGELGDGLPWLLGHVRIGGAAVLGRAEDDTMGNEAEGSQTVGAFFVGAAFEARQPLVEGLQLTLALGIDALVDPVRFEAGGQLLVREGPVRLSARLGLAYRVD